jgi:hypothetical protein
MTPFSNLLRNARVGAASSAGPTWSARVRTSVRRPWGPLRVALMGFGPALLALSVGSCATDTVHSGAVSALESLGEGPYGDNNSRHRPGQPCLTCHGFQGPSASRFAAAGTVYWGTCNPPLGEKDPAKTRAKWCQLTPASGAEVRIRDAGGGTKCFVTNCAGNFYVRDTDFGSSSSQFLKFPLLVNVGKIGTVAGVKTPYIKSMYGHIGRAGSCADCHRQENFADSPGQVYLISDIHSLPSTSQPDEFKSPKSCKDAPPPSEELSARSCSNDVLEDRP